MVDLFEKLRMEAGPLAKYSHLPDDYFFFPKLEGEIGPRMKFNGKTVLNWSLNNYLGLANHPEVRKADAEAAGGPLGHVDRRDGNTNEFQSRSCRSPGRSRAGIVQLGAREPGGRPHGEA